MKRIWLSMVVFAVSVLTAGSIYSSPKQVNDVFKCDTKTYGKKALKTLVLANWQKGKSLSNQAAVNDYSKCQFIKQIRSIYISAWANGEKLTEHWSDKPNSVKALAEAVMQYKKQLPPNQIANVNTLELHLNYDFVPFEGLGNSNPLYIQDMQGMLGLELRYGQQLERYPATYFTIMNTNYRNVINTFTARHKLVGHSTSKEVDIQYFDADKYIMTLGTKPEIQKIYRADAYVPVESVTQKNVEKWLARATDWMTNNVHPNGRMTYRYYVDQEKEELNKNNILRQWMATVALGRIAKNNFSAYMKNTALAEKNINYNLRKFYREKEGLGYIYFSKKSKLGSNALAAVSLIEHPNRSKWSRQEKAIRKLIRTLWNQDGSFKTFYIPAHRNDQQNFYPGEALYLWGIIYAQERDPELYDMFMKSFRYYKKWHLNPRNRNPAFVPWHAQAYYMIWKITKNQEMADFIFEMNDWLVDVMQQWENEVPYQDAWGRFFSPVNPYGPPHSSATGVYLEGLIDAFSLAKQLKDAKRVEKYRLAIIRGLRSMMQLQYKNEMDMYYIKPPLRKYVYGGVRSTIYDSVVRCDNIQHALMAVQKITKVFTAKDYKH